GQWPLSPQRRQPRRADARDAARVARPGGKAGADARTTWPSRPSPTDPTQENDWKGREVASRLGNSSAGRVPRQKTGKKRANSAKLLSPYLHKLVYTIGSGRAAATAPASTRAGPRFTLRNRSHAMSATMTVEAPSSQTPEST